jgi:hypothetical protein
MKPNQEPKIIVPNEQELVEYELEHEREVWLVHKDIDDRANHMNGLALKGRVESMARIDGLLDRLLAVS